MVNKKNFIILFLINLFIIMVLPVKADTNNLEQKYNRIVFVLDCSNSMNTNDSQKISNEIMKMLTDSFFENTEIGLVFYNDSILKNYPITNISDENKKNEIKKEIDDIIRKGSTDIGLALSHAVNMFPKNKENNENNIIVLFSDGETDLTYTKTERTLNDSINDENSAYKKALEIKCRIFTIGLSNNGKLDTQYLNKISANTNAKSYTIQNTNEIPKIFSDIYENITGIIPNNSSIILENTKNKITIGLPNNYSLYTNILIHTTKDLKNINTNYNENDVKIYSSKNYSIIKVLKPANENIIINFESEEENLNINTIDNINIVPKIEVPENISLLNVPINIELYDKNTGKKADNALYKGLSGEINIIDIENKTEQKIALGNANKMLTATFQNTNPKKYILQANVKGEKYNEISNQIEVEFSNTEPFQLNNKKISILKNAKENKIDLNDYFDDNDGDILTYQIEKNKNSFKTEIDKNILKITPAKESIENIMLNVSDGRGGVITSALIIDIMPFWTYYKNRFIGILTIFAVLFLLYFIFIKKRKVKKVIAKEETPKTGTVFIDSRFEGYFLNTLSGNEIPVLNWNASYINNRQSITLRELFSILDVNEKLPESGKIYFDAGKNGTVIFHHDTNCIVSLGKRDIPKGKKEILNYDDKIYIVFEDDVTEIEIRYKKIRNKINA